MKHRLQTLLKHKLQWLVLLTALLGVSQGVWGATSTTLYYAISSSDVGSYTVKAHVNLQGDADNWADYDMADTGETYYGNKLYSCSFTDLYDGLGCIQFQLYDGGTFKSQYQPFGTRDWHSASTYNGKICVKDDSTWKDYKYDRNVTVRIKKDGDYGSTPPYLYAWDPNADEPINGDWPGTRMSDGELATTGCYKASITHHEETYKIIVNNGSGSQTGNSDPLSGDVCFTISSNNFNAATATKPTVTSTAAASITSTTATLGGNVTDAGQTASCGAQTVTARGIEWVSGTGKTAGTKEAAAAGGTGSYTVDVTGLSASTTYTYKAYATNAAGTSYGSNTSFTTTASCSDPIITVQPSGSWQKCGNDTGRELSITATGGSGTLTYQWYRNTTNTLTDGVADLTGATAVTDMVEGGNTYSPSASDYGVFYYCCVVRSGGACSANKATSVYTGAIEIKQTPTVKPSTITVKQYEPVRLQATNSSVDWSITSYPGGAAADEYYFYDETKSSAMFKGKTGSYTITATSTGSDCTSTSAITVNNDDSEGC